MSGATDLAAMLAGLRVHARPGEYVFVTGAGAALATEAEASEREDEGRCCVLRRECADALAVLTSPAAERAQ